MNDLSSEQILDLISSTDEEVVMKAVGLLRNVLADRQDVDTIMESYAGQVMQVISFFVCFRDFAGSLFSRLRLFIRIFRQSYLTAMCVCIFVSAVPGLYLCQE